MKNLVYLFIIALPLSCGRSTSMKIDTDDEEKNFTNTISCNINTNNSNNNTMNSNIQHPPVTNINFPHNNHLPPHPNFSVQDLDMMIQNLSASNNNTSNINIYTNTNSNNSQNRNNTHNLNNIHPNHPPYYSNFSQNTGYPSNHNTPTQISMNLQSNINQSRNHNNNNISFNRNIQNSNNNMNTIGYSQHNNNIQNNIIYNNTYRRPNNRRQLYSNSIQNRNSTNISNSNNTNTHFNNTRQVLSNTNSLSNNNNPNQLRDHEKLMYITSKVINRSNMILNKINNSNNNRKRTYNNYQQSNIPTDIPITNINHQNKRQKLNISTYLNNSNQDNITNKNMNSNKMGLKYFYNIPLQLIESTIENSSTLRSSNIEDTINDLESNAQSFLPKWEELREYLNSGKKPINGILPLKIKVFLTRKDILSAETTVYRIIENNFDIQSVDIDKKKYRRFYLATIFLDHSNLLKYYDTLNKRDRINLFLVNSQFWNFCSEANNQFDSHKSIDEVVNKIQSLNRETYENFLVIFKKIYNNSLNNEGYKPIPKLNLSLCKGVLKLYKQTSISSYDLDKLGKILPEFYKTIVPASLVYCNDNQDWVYYKHEYGDLYKHRYLTEDFERSLEMIIELSISEKFERTKTDMIKKAHNELISNIYDILDKYDRTCSEKTMEAPLLYYIFKEKSMGKIFSLFHSLNLNQYLSKYIMSKKNPERNILIENFFSINLRSKNYQSLKLLKEKPLKNNLLEAALNYLYREEEKFDTASKEVHNFLSRNISHKYIKNLEIINRNKPIGFVLGFYKFYQLDADRFKFKYLPTTTKEFSNFLESSYSTYEGPFYNSNNKNLCEYLRSITYIYEGMQNRLINLIVKIIEEFYKDKDRSKPQKISKKKQNEYPYELIIDKLRTRYEWPSKKLIYRLKQEGFSLCGPIPECIGNNLLRSRSLSIKDSFIYTMPRYGLFNFFPNNCFIDMIPSNYLDTKTIKKEGHAYYNVKWMDMLKLYINFYDENFQNGLSNDAYRYEYNKLKSCNNIVNEYKVPDVIIQIIASYSYQSTPFFGEKSSDMFRNIINNLENIINNVRSIDRWLGNYLSYTTTITEPHQTIKKFLYKDDCDKIIDVMNNPDKYIGQGYIFEMKALKGLTPLTRMLLNKR